MIIKNIKKNPFMRWRYRFIFSKSTNENNLVVRQQVV